MNKDAKRIIAALVIILLLASVAMIIPATRQKSTPEALSETEVTATIDAELLKAESHVIAIGRTNPAADDYIPQRLATICARFDQDAIDANYLEHIILIDEFECDGLYERVLKAFDHIKADPTYAEQCYDRLITFY